LYNISYKNLLSHFATITLWLVNIWRIEIEGKNASRRPEDKKTRCSWKFYRKASAIFKPVFMAGKADFTFVGLNEDIKPMICFLGHNIYKSIPVI
jgi:hypothetical protein